MRINRIASNADQIRSVVSADVVFGIHPKVRVTSTKSLGPKPKVSYGPSVHQLYHLIKAEIKGASDRR